ncbi:hypothetical protein BC332_18911 [Capsicum chinense]|nr:hypothetical protein BC332_18911 [Capsicum chinense]
MANIFGAAKKCISIGEGFRVAVEIMMDYMKELKGTNSNIIGKVEKIEKEIKQLIELDSEIRMKVRDMKKISRFAVMEGDSSYNSVGHFIEQVASIPGLVNTGADAEYLNQHKSNPTLVNTKALYEEIED